MKGDFGLFGKSLFDSIAAYHDVNYSEKLARLAIFEETVYAMRSFPEGYAVCIECRLPYDINATTNVTYCGLWHSDSSHGNGCECELACGRLSCTLQNAKRCAECNEYACADDREPCGVVGCKNVMCYACAQLCAFDPSHAVCPQHKAASLMCVECVMKK